MTVGYIQETAIDRYCEWSTQRPMPAVERPPSFPCPFCAQVFSSRRTLSDHLGHAHRGERPILLIRGREPASDFRETRVLATEDIEARNTTRVCLVLDGVRHDGVASDNFGRLLAGIRRAHLVIRLENHFEAALQPIIQSYHFHLDAPDRDRLAAIDWAFIAHFARTPIDFSAVERFLNAVGGHRAGEIYAEALAAYARGVLVKDRPKAANVRLAYAEYRALYGQAIDGLAGFSRPVADMVKGAVALALNDFSDSAITGDAALDRLFARLAPLAGRPAAEGRRASKQVGSLGRQAIAPLDDGVTRLSALNDRLSQRAAWTPALADECREAAFSSRLDVPDRQKALALWACAALAGADEGAREPLQELAATHPFGPWAGAQLERLLA